MALDLDFIQENLGNFATFGKNIGTALQDIPELLKAFFEFFGNLDALSSNTDFASSLPAEATTDAAGEAETAANVEG